MKIFHAGQKKLANEIRLPLVHFSQPTVLKAFLSNSVVVDQNLIIGGYKSAQKNSYRASNNPLYHTSDVRAQRGTCLLYTSRCV